MRLRNLCLIALCLLVAPLREWRARAAPAAPGDAPHRWPRPPERADADAPQPAAPLGGAPAAADTSRAFDAAGPARRAASASNPGTASGGPAAITSAGTAGGPH